MALKNNTWTLNNWYDQDVAGNVSYGGQKEFWVWGANNDGALGLNQAEAQLTGKSSPTQITGTPSWKSVRSNYDARHVLATKTDGPLWAWGFCNDGNLELNNRTARSSPTQIAGTTWALCSTMKYSSKATKTDGTLWAWGYNGYGQLGQNDKTSRSSPVQVGSDSTWPTENSDHIGGTSESGMAIKTDGTLWAWGYNSLGRLGLNDTTNYSSPVQIGTGSDWATVSTSTKYFNAAIKTDGTLWTWGQNKYGSLGLNQSGPGAPTPDNQNLSSPTQVPGTTWKIISGGAQAWLATKTDGTLWACGRNYNGMLGQNDEIMYSSPAQIPGTDWDRPLALDSRSAAIKTDGTLWTWGSNGIGNLGQNSPANSDRSSPVQVGSDTTWDSSTGKMSGWGENNIWGFMKNV